MKRIIYILLLILLLSSVSSAKFADTNMPEWKNTILVFPATANVFISPDPSGSDGIKITSDTHLTKIQIPYGKAKEIRAIEPVIHVDDYGNSKIIFIIPSSVGGMLEFEMEYSSNCLWCFTGMYNQTYLNITNTSILNLSSAPFNSSNITSLVAIDLVSPTLNKNLTSSCHGEMNTSGLVYCANFEYDVNDTSGNNNNGTWYGNTSVNFTTGKIGNGLRLDGVNDYINVGNNTIFNITSAITITAWIKREAQPLGWPMLLGKSTGTYTIQINGGTKRIGFWGTVGGVPIDDTTGPVIPESVWSHIAVRYNGSKIDYFVNGISEGGIAASGSIATDTNSFLIGKTNGDSVLFSGSIDEVRIYNRGLNATEIAYNYRNSPKAVQIHTNANLTESANYSQTDMPATVAIPTHPNDASDNNPGSVVSTVGEVLHYSFNETSGAFAFDRSGNGNNGTLISMNTSGNSTSGWNNSDCKYRGCLKFDGVDDYIDGGKADSLNISGEITISTWYKSSAISSQILIEKSPSSGTGYNLLVTSGFEGRLYPTSISSTKNVRDGIWHHLVMTNNPNSTLNLYVDGINVKSQAGVSIGQNANNLTIGLRSGGTFQSNSTMDEIRIWARSLSGEEVYALYSNGAIDHLHFVYPKNASVDGLPVYDYDVNTNLTSSKISVGYTQDSTIIQDTSTNGIHTVNMSILHASNFTSGTITNLIADGTYLGATYKGSGVTLSTNNPNATVTRNSTHYIISEGQTNNTTTYIYNITDYYNNAPSVSVDAQVFDNFENVNIVFSATDPESNTLACYGKLNGTTITNCTSPHNFTILAAGIYNYTLNVTDTGATTNQTWTNVSATIEINGTNTPRIITWGNNFTGNNSTTIIVPKYTHVQFNITANHTATWNWSSGIIAVTGNGTNVSTGDYNFSVYGSHNISVHGNNINGPGNTITWNVIVPGECCFSIEGYILNQIGLPIPNSRLDYNNTFTFTDSQGYYSFTGITESNSTLLARQIFYSNSSESIYIGSNMTHNITLKEYRPAGTMLSPGIDGLLTSLIIILSYLFIYYRPKQPVHDNLYI